MTLLIEKSPHGWRCHVLNMDLYGAEGISVWHAIELANDAVEAAQLPHHPAPDEAWDAFRATMGCDFCEWCGRLCPRWSAMCAPCGAPIEAMRAEWGTP